MQNEESLTHSLMQKRFPRWAANPVVYMVHFLNLCTGGWFSKQPKDLHTVYTCVAFALARVEGSTGCLHSVLLAFLFWKRGFLLIAALADDFTFRDLTFWLRRVIVQINKSDGHNIFPGYIDQYRLKTEGRASTRRNCRCHSPVLFGRTCYLW